MLSQKVDLTENRDFSGNSEDMFMEDLPVGEILRGEAPSLEEHTRYIEKVKTFGKKYHEDESLSIFGFKTLHRINETCWKCGKQIPPWSSTHSICEKCRKEAQSFIPWSTGARWAKEGEHHFRNTLDLR